MTLTIGRIGVSTANGGDGWSLAGPVNVTRQGAGMTVSGVLYDYTDDELIWRADTLRGLLSGDEPVVPVTFSDAPGLDGYYRVVGVDCGFVTVGNNGLVPWTVELEMLKNFRRPRIDLVTGYGLMTNGHTVTVYDAVVGLPGPTVDGYPPFAPNLNASRPVSEGSAVLVLGDTSATSSGVTGTGRLVLPPASYYHGSCRVEWDIGASVFRQATGRLDFPASGVLRLTNGLIRVAVTYGSAGASDLSVQWWDGSQWDTATEFYVEGVGTHAELVYYAASIIRNTAEQVTVKFSTVAASFSAGMADVTFSIRRGSRWVSAYAESAVAPATGWRVGFATAAASTSLTGGLRRTSNNGGGNREILAGQYATTKDLTNGRLTTASINAALLGIGCEVAGSSATAQSTAANQVDEWYCAMAERAVMVAG